MAFELVRLMLGAPPDGLEYLEYVFALIVTLWTLKFVLEMFIHVFNIFQINIGGKKNG